MSELQKPEEHREKLIDQIYEVVLNPEQTNDFMANWERYISHMSQPFNERRNSEGGSEVLLEDDALEHHFARAHALLERINHHDNIKPERNFLCSENNLFQFDQDGRVVYQNAWSCEHFGKVRDVREIANLFDEVSASEWEVFVTTFKRAPKVEYFQVFSEVNFGNLVAFTTRDERSGKLYLVLRRLHAHWNAELRNILLCRFGLTERELEVVEELSRHGSLETITKTSERSKNTLRTQMKSIFRKLKVRSQPEVMQSIAMLSHFCSFMKFDEQPNATAGTLGHVELVKLQSGEEVPVHFHGPVNGRPILFIHGMMDGVAITAETVLALEAHNLRLVAPIRPNFGNAPHNDDIENAPEIFTKQLCEIVQILDLNNFFLAGHMSGSVYAFAASQALSSKALGIINISGGVPILSTNQFSAMSHRQKAFSYTARFTPALLPVLLRTSLAQIDKMGYQNLADDMYPVGLRDHEVMQDGEISAIVQDGYRFSVAQGYKGFHADAVQVTRNWSAYIRNNQLPVLLLHGRHDPVVCVKSVEEFAKREKFKIHVFEDEGQLIFYGCPAQVMSEIANFVGQL